MFQIFSSPVVVPPPPQQQEEQQQQRWKNSHPWDLISSKAATNNSCFGPLRTGLSSHSRLQGSGPLDCCETPQHAPIKHKSSSYWTRQHRKQKRALAKEVRRKAEKDKTKRATGLGRRTREEIFFFLNGIKLTTLRFQTGGGERHQNRRGLPPGEEHRRQSGRGVLILSTSWVVWPGVQCCTLSLLLSGRKGERKQQSHLQPTLCKLVISYPV